MNERLIKRIKNADLDETIKTMEVFDYKVESKETINNKTIVTFVRDTSTPFYQDIVKKEKAWNKEMEPHYKKVYIVLLIAVLVITSALIVRFIFNNEILTYVTLGVGILTSTLAAVLFMLEVTRFQKIIPVYLDKRYEIKKEIEEIKKQYENI